MEKQSTTRQGTEQGAEQSTEKDAQSSSIAVLGIASGFVVGLCATALLLVSILDRAEVPKTPVGLDAMHHLDISFQRSLARRPTPYSTVFLGDSLAAVSPVHVTTADWVSNTLARTIGQDPGLGKSIAPMGIVYTGLSVYSHFFMSDRILELEPNTVVLEFNLFYFSKWWLARERKQFVGWLPTRTWSDALRLPLYEIGLSTDRILYYRALLSARQFDSWRWVEQQQARAANGYWSLAEYLEDGSSSPAIQPSRNAHRREFLKKRAVHTPAGPRATAFYADQLLGKALRGVELDHPALQVLSTFLSMMQREGIQTITFVPPHNIDRLESLGLANDEGLKKTLAAIERTVAESGGTFVDLHDLLSDKYFRDNMDHLSGAGSPNASQLIADRLAPFVLEDARRVLAPES